MGKLRTLRVVGYARVSTSEQASEGVSLAAQAAKVRGFAALHDLDLVGIEEDAGVSAKTLNRPAVARVLAMLASGEADGVIVAKLDRLSRSVRDWNRLIDEYFGPGPGKQLFSVADSIDTRTAGGRLVLNVLMSVAQWEREAIAERTKDALAHKRSLGEALGPPPFGWRLDGDGRTLAMIPEEQAALEHMASLRLDGVSDRRIADLMNSLEIRPHRAAKWSHPTVAKVLRGVPKPDRRLAS